MGKRSIPVTLRGAFEYFVHSQVAGSILLLACTIIALIWANSPAYAFYEHILHLKLSFSIGDTTYGLTLHHWINDGLMVIFFFVVGLEIKRELVVGQLSTFDRALLPVAAAVGGMLIPAVMYVIVNRGGPGASGWGVPMATDIAFALGVLAIFGSRVPVGLKVFLTALAIADDLGAVLVIAIFYTEKIHLFPLLLAGLLLAGLLLLVRRGFKRVGILLMLAFAVWLAVFVSGIHATVAGILLALVIPVRPRAALSDLVELARKQADRIEAMEFSSDSILQDQRQLDAVEQLHRISLKALPSGLVMEHDLHPIQVWLILPLFALANAGVHFDTHILETIFSPISLGIILGLVLGKPLGICLMSWLVLRSGRGALPEGVSWGQVLGAGFLAGIGFTMSLFVTGLAFGEPMMVAQSKVGILGASLISGIIGFMILGASLPKKDTFGSHRPGHQL